MKCRHCAPPLSLHDLFLDLGSAPPSNAYLMPRTALRAPETWFPLRCWSARRCWLVQTEDYAAPRRAVHATTTPTSARSPRRGWRTRSAYVAAMRERLDARRRAPGRRGRRQRRLPAAVRRSTRGIPCLGIEPTASTAAAARAKGIEIDRARSSASTLARRWRAGPAARPDGRQQRAGARARHQRLRRRLRATAQAPQGTVTFEFPHLLQLVAAEPVRHRLPRALLVPVAARGAAHLRAERPARVRRRGAAHARRQPARVRAARGDDPRPTLTPAWPRCWRARPPPAWAGASSTPASRRAPSASRTTSRAS